MKNTLSAAQRILVLLLAVLALRTAPGGCCISEDLLPRAAAAETEKDSTLNILLIGQDGREPEEGARSDSMILCSFDTARKKLTLTSFLRDLYVTIPGHGKNRLNAAYAFGGSDLLERTLENNFGIRVDGCVEVNFACFPILIDTLGGVSLDLRADEAAYLNRHTGSDLQEGAQLLSGQQALVYARIRKLDADGDFSRTRRQRKVLIALWDGYRDAGLVKGIALVRKVMPYVSTNMKKETILAHAKAIMPQLSGLRLSSQTVPAEDGCVSRTIDGMDVLIADMDAARRQLKASIGN